MAENFNDFSFCAHPAFRIACQADDDFVPLDCAVFGVFRDEDVIRNFLSSGMTKPKLFVSV